MKQQQKNPQQHKLNKKKGKFEKGSEAAKAFMTMMREKRKPKTT